MQERAWVKDFFTRWKRKARPIGGDRAFYAILHQFHPETLNVSPLVFEQFPPENDNDAALADLWRAWNEVMMGNSNDGRNKLKRIAKTVGKRHEPFVFLGIASLLKGDRKLAHQALTRASKLYPDDEQVKLLISRLGYRRPPVLPFLDRTNALNVALGKLRARLTN